MLQEELTKAIIEIHDNTGNKIEYTEAKIDLVIAKYSQTKKPSNNLIIDGVPHRNKNYKITYKCERCGSINTILLCKYLVKANVCCCHCKETPEKSEWHSKVMKMKRSGVQYISKNKRKNKEYNFDEETEGFKKEYYKKFLTVDEFNTIKNHIYSINGVIVENKDITFLPHEKVNNGMKYRQMVVINGEKISFQKIKLKCAFCGNIFSVTRKLKERLKNNNFDCKDCYLNNKVFKIKKINDNLTYQGKEEFNFINSCIERKINITNGPKIKYLFEGRERTYFVDFELPELKILVEIKDNHIWHRKQVESGKWQAKEDAAKKYANKNGYVFHLLFPKDIEKFFKETVRDSLNNSENC